MHHEYVHTFVHTNGQTQIKGPPQILMVFTDTFNVNERVTEKRNKNDVSPDLFVIDKGVVASVRTERRLTEERQATVKWIVRGKILLSTINIFLIFLLDNGHFYQSAKSYR